MPYLLDTNACVEYLRKRNANVVRRVQMTPPDQIVLCSVVVGELCYGAYKNPPATRSSNLTLLQQLCSTFVSLPFDDLAADEFGRIRTDLEARGQVIGPFDMQIAAIAITHHFTLVTHNTGEFSRIPNLIFEDWTLP